MNHTLSSLKAFKRGASLELSRWYMGNLTTNLAETKDTNGAFCLVEVTLAPGSNPPPHVHSLEDELFYVLEGEFDVYAGEDAFKVETGQCVFSSQIQAARICYALAPASPPDSVHSRGVGRRLS